MCNFNDVITPHPTHPPQPHVLRSIQHVCNFNDVFTPHPTHPPNPTHVTGVKENAFIAPFTVGEARSETRRYVRLEPKTNSEHLKNRWLEDITSCLLGFGRSIFRGRLAVGFREGTIFLESTGAPKVRSVFFFGGALLPNIMRVGCLLTSKPKNPLIGVGF